MSTQDEDPLRLEPPQGQPPAGNRQPAPQPAPPAPAPPPAPAGAELRRAGEELQPGAGKPLVEGPPMSVGEPVQDTTINRAAAFAGIGVLGVGAIVALVVIVLVVLAVCTHH